MDVTRVDAQDSPDDLPAQPVLELGDLPYLLRADEVAQLLRVSRKAIYCMVHRGTLPGVLKIGQRVRFRRDDLLTWLESQ